MAESSIAGYEFGSPALARSPVSLEEFELLKKTVLFSEEDADALRRPELVSGQRQRGDPRGRDVEGEGRRRLDRVGVQAAVACEHAVAAFRPGQPVRVRKIDISRGVKKP